MTTRKPLIIGPFSKGLNTYDDPTAIQDTELVEAINFDPGFDGSLRSRPPFFDTGTPLSLGASGNARLLGYYYDTTGLPHLIASDGLSSTWRYSGGAWVLITNTFAATDMAQFDGKAWLLPPVGESDPGGYWSLSGGFVTDADMPKGTSITSYKSRLWIAEGVGGPNPTRIRYSKVLGQPSFWASASFLDVGAGDGQSVVKIMSYFDTMLVFRTKSIWSFQYGVDPATAIQGVIVPGVGLQTSRAVVSYESYLYFMYDEKAYRFINNRAEQINIKVPFRASNLGATQDPFHVSLFNNRILYSYYEMIYVYSLRTQTWTTWRSDAWGPIGQVMSSFVSGDTDEAFALPSRTIGPQTTRTNRDLNPRGISSGDLSAFGTRFSWVRSFQISGAEPVLPYGNLVRFTSPETGAVAGRGIDSYGNMDLAAPGTTGDFVAGPTIAGNTTYTFSRWVRLGAVSSAANYTIRVRAHDGAGNWVGAATSAAFPITSTSAWVRVWVTATMPPGATRFCAQVVVGSLSVTTSSFMDITGLQTEVGALQDNFDGSYTNTVETSHSWFGTINASVSVRTALRYVPTLSIQDRFGLETEAMECSIQTKNYNFDVPGSYKVLFWWGLDAIFKTNVTAQVSPVLFNAVTTWGQILATEKTWGNLLTRTWKFPLSEGETGVTTEVVAAAGPSRKFVKFFKKLRFRQLYFRISFNTDGSSSTSPVQIFSLSTYMAEKQTVSKQIS